MAAQRLPTALFKEAQFNSCRNYCPKSRASANFSLRASQKPLDDDKNKFYKELGMFSLKKRIEDSVLRAEMLAPTALEFEEAKHVDQEEVIRDYDLWDDLGKSNEILAKLADSAKVVDTLRDLTYKAEEAKLITELAEMDAINYELFKQAYTASLDVNKFLDKYEMSKLLKDPYDVEGACITIESRCGDTYSERWASQLAQMYMKWAERQGHAGRIVERTPSNNGGLKSAIIELEFRFAYGYLSGERGEHSLIRSSENTSALPVDTRTGKIVGRGTEHRGLYYVDGIAQKGAAMLTQGLTKEQAWLWHRRLGHPSIGYLRLIYPNLDISHPLNCETCFLAKSHRHSFKPNNTRMRSVFSLIHSDVWGPAPVTSDNGFRYFLLFVDDCSRMTWVYFLKSKNEVFEKFTHFYNLVQTQYKKSIQILRSDNRGEYVNSKMQNFFTEKGLVHQTTCPYTPKHNEVVERKNRIILEMTRALIIDSQVPKSYWPEAVATSVYLLNRLPTHALHFKPPLEFLATHSEIPSSLTLKPKVFGCTVYVHIPKQNHTKFSPNAVKCVFLGYGKNQKGYRCYDPVANHLHTTLNCDFVETEYFFYQQGSQGEKQVIVDSLSWLHTPSTIQTILPLPSHLGETSSASLPGSVPDVGPTEKVSAPAETSTTQVKFKMSSDSIPLSTPSSNPEVSNLNSSQVNTNVEEQRDGDTDTKTGGDTKKDGERTELAGATDQYTLPPRSTRGKPPKRYSPDWQGRKTRTKHVDKLSIGNAVT